MKKMDILQISRMLAMIGSILLSLAIILPIFTDFIVKKPKKEEQKIEDTFVSDVYGFYKDGKWIKDEEPAIGEKVFENNNDGSYNIGIGTEAVKSCSYQPIKLEEWQIRQIEYVKKKGWAGISLTLNGCQMYVSFNGSVEQTTGF